eukprot:208211-Chlamydomonas_euryale.AAC.1
MHSAPCVHTPHTTSPLSPAHHRRLHLQVPHAQRPGGHHDSSKVGAELVAAMQQYAHTCGGGMASAAGIVGRWAKGERGRKVGRGGH